MKNNMEIFKNDEFGTVRVLQDGDKYLFCGSDVAKALGIPIHAKR
jgi:prophage antirepressor-like protein